MQVGGIYSLKKISFLCNQTTGLLRPMHRITKKNENNMMKHLILSLLAATALCLAASAQQRTVTERDSLGRTIRIIEVLDTVRDGRAETDTLSITTYEEPVDKATSSRTVTVSGDWHLDDFWPFNTALVNGLMLLLVLLFLGFPLILILVIIYFRNKNRKRKYLLLQQALANGQPLPREAFKEITIPDNRTKGFKNIFLGLGLFIFIWALTGEFGLACVGLLVMFVGFGQLAIHYTRPRQEQEVTKLQEAEEPRKEDEPQAQDNESAQ